MQILLLALPQSGGHAGLGLNPFFTDGNPADERIIQILSASKGRFLGPNTR
jgi:hypothetical protein